MFRCYENRSDGMTVKKGNKVKVEYTGMLEDGKVFDSSEKHGKPLEFKTGEGNMIKGFENAVMGMKKGESKEVELKPEEAYGNKKPELVREIPRDKLPQEAELKAGMVLGMTLPNGMQIPAKIVEINEEGAKLDLNHPLAGKTLKFKIKLLEVS